MDKTIIGRIGEKAISKAMYCKHCGEEIAVDSSFCRYCGTHLNEQNSSVLESTDDDVDVSSDNVFDSTSFKEIVSNGELLKTGSLHQEVEDCISNNDSFHDSKFLKVLGILSGIIIWSIIAVLGLGITIYFLFFLCMIFMMNMPNGMGITICCIILLIAAYLFVKLIIYILKSFRK